jgi:hypothetical protein
MRTRFGWMLLAIAGLVAGTASGASAQSAKPKPHIVATPNNVMVNSKVHLVGSDFPANTKLVLRECGVKNWIAPQNPCTPTMIRVTTDKHGGFKKTMTAKICPMTEDWPGHPITERRCFVGETMPSGVDVIDLTPHVRIIVTYP